MYYRCCQGDQCVIASELARYQCVIAVVNEFSGLSRLNWQGISVLSLLSRRSGCTSIELTRYQCVITVVKEVSVLSRLNWQGISVLSLLSL